MVEIVDELKAKLAEIDAKIDELRREIVVLGDQKSAFEKVIKVYDPGFEPDAQRARRTLSRETASSRVTELLKSKNNRHIVLDILRRSERPTTTAEIAEKFASEADLGSEAARLESALTSRFSATLNGLVKQGLVRQAGTEDGRRHLWEISR
ncbi:MarR family transcriptional regulator [Rhizobium rhizogenes]